MARLLLFLYQLSARWPKGLKTKSSLSIIDARWLLRLLTVTKMTTLRSVLHLYLLTMVTSTGIIVSVAIPVCSRTLTRATFYRFARVLSVASPPSLIASFSTRHPPLPKTFKDAMASPEAESWYAASVTELNSVGLHKEDAEGNIISYKARLVVQSFAPRLGIDYHKTFAPVSSITTILFVVGLSAACGLILEQWS
ncbi:BZ3501_MvSof-1269-A2-R1_Chr12-1g03317 [Microbotryum saponariae]|nr:BZ3501_MvSof-1269-A2-R1_Chr12-1g03317 [Microbotryum saponariae]